MRRCYIPCHVFPLSQALLQTVEPLHYDGYVHYVRILLRFASALARFAHFGPAVVTMRRTLAQAGAVSAALLDYYVGAEALAEVGVTLPQYAAGGVSFADAFRTLAGPAEAYAPHPPRGASRARLALLAAPSSTAAPAAAWRPGQPFRSGSAWDVTVMQAQLASLGGRALWALLSAGGDIDDIRSEADKVLRWVAESRVASVGSSSPRSPPAPLAPGIAIGPAAAAESPEALWQSALGLLSMARCCSPEAAVAADAALQLHDASLEYLAAWAVCPKVEAMEAEAQATAYVSQFTGRRDATSNCARLNEVDIDEQISHQATASVTSPQRSGMCVAMSPSTSAFSSPTLAGVTAPSISAGTKRDWATAMEHGDESPPSARRSASSSKYSQGASMAPATPLLRPSNPVAHGEQLSTALASLALGKHSSCASSPALGPSSAADAPVRSMNGETVCCDVDASASRDARNCFSTILSPGGNDAVPSTTTMSDEGVQVPSNTAHALGSANSSSSPWSYGFSTPVTKLVTRYYTYPSESTSSASSAASSSATIDSSRYSQDITIVGDTTLLDQPSDSAPFSSSASSCSSACSTADLSIFIDSDVLAHRRDGGQCSRRDGRRFAAPTATMRRILRVLENDLESLRDTLRSLGVVVLADGSFLEQPLHGEAPKRSAGHDADDGRPTASEVTLPMPFASEQRVGSAAQVDSSHCGRRIEGTNDGAGRSSVKLSHGIRGGSSKRARQTSDTGRRNDNVNVSPLSSSHHSTGESADHVATRLLYVEKHNDNGNAAVLPPPVSVAAELQQLHVSPRGAPQRLCDTAAAEAHGPQRPSPSRIAPVAIPVATPPRVSTALSCGTGMVTPPMCESIASSDANVHQRRHTEASSAFRPPPRSPGRASSVPPPSEPSQRHPGATVDSHMNQQGATDDGAVSSGGRLVRPIIAAGPGLFDVSSDLQVLPFSPSMRASLARLPRAPRSEHRGSRVHWSADVCAAEETKRRLRLASFDGAMHAPDGSPLPQVQALNGASHDACLSPLVLPTSPSPTGGVALLSASPQHVPPAALPGGAAALRAAAFSPVLPAGRLPPSVGAASRAPGGWPHAIPSRRCVPLRPQWHCPLSSAFEYRMGQIGAAAAEALAAAADPAASEDVASDNCYGDTGPVDVSAPRTRRFAKISAARIFTGSPGLVTVPADILAGFDACDELRDSQLVAMQRAFVAATAELALYRQLFPGCALH